MRAKFINEVGEATVKPAPFEYFGEQPSDEKNVKTYMYMFVTDKNDYQGRFFILPNDPQVAGYHFNRGGRSGDEIVNAGELFIVMSTNVKIIQDFIKRKNIKAIVIEGHKEAISMQKRLKLYAKFIQKQLPEDMALVTDVNKDGDIERLIIYDREWMKKRRS